MALRESPIAFGPSKTLNQLRSWRKEQKSDKQKSKPLIMEVISSLLFLCCPSDILLKINTVPLVPDTTVNRGAPPVI